MARSSVFLAVLALSCGIVRAQAPEDWISLFNGRDLTGWTPKITKHALGDNHANTFRVDGGVLEVRYDGYGRFDGQFGHLFHEAPYSYYRLTLEYRFSGEQVADGPGAWAVRNSGVMVHSQDPRTMLRDQDFPISIEAQFLGGLSNGAPRSTLNVCTPGTEIVYAGVLHPEHCLGSSSATFDGDQWVQVELVVLGGALITHKVNGKTVLEYALPQLGGGEVHSFDPRAKQDGRLLDAGYIALQSESHPIDFRNIRLLNLAGCMDRKATNYRSYYVKSEPRNCRY